MTEPLAREPRRGALAAGTQDDVVQIRASAKPKLILNRAALLRAEAV